MGLIKKSFLLQNVTTGGSLSISSKSGIIGDVTLTWVGRSIVPGETQFAENSFWIAFKDSAGKNVLGELTDADDVIIVPPLGSFNFQHPYIDSLDGACSAIVKMAVSNTNNGLAVFKDSLNMTYLTETDYIAPQDLAIDITFMEFE